MKRFAVFSIVMMCLIINSLAQQPNQKSNSPKENSTVNREYDENGNLIRFDSTYTYSWSNDTTMMNHMSPEEMKVFFGDHFKFFNDSSFVGNSFFNEFDQMFSNHFGSVPDSTLMKRFGMTHPHAFNLDRDSTTEDFPDFDNFFWFSDPAKKDSVASKNRKEPYVANRHSMSDIMQMMQQQMKEMEEMHQRFFEEYHNQKSQPGLKEF